jgi:hypothetical protein
MHLNHCNCASLWLPPPRTPHQGYGFITFANPSAAQQAMVGGPVYSSFLRQGFVHYSALLGSHIRSALHNAASLLQVSFVIAAAELL